MTVIRAGLIGDHIGQSRLSRALALLGELDRIWIEFEAVDTAQKPEFDFDAYVDELRSAGWTGVTITHPWKTRAAAYAGESMSSEVSHLGAANTLIFKPGFEGFNTDYTGFVRAWNTHMRRRPGKVAIAGAGGVARAIAPALLSLGAAEITVWDKDHNRATELAAALGPKARSCPVERSKAAIRSADGLVNATPMGMGYRGGTAFEPELIGPQSWAFDAVYTPTETPFLARARECGLRVLTGFDLFCHMAMDSYEHYSGRSPNRDVALPLLERLRPTEPVGAIA